MHDRANIDNQSVYPLKRNNGSETIQNHNSISTYSRAQREVVIRARHGFKTYLDNRVFGLSPAFHSLTRSGRQKSE